MALDKSADGLFTGSSPLATRARKKTATPGYAAVGEPPRGERPTNQEILARAATHPVEIMRTWNPDLFELFVHEWVYSCLTPAYGKVVWAPGSGDKGRDVRAFVTDERGEWDNFQCKRYGAMLTPGDAWLELGKLCHYTFLGPQNGGYRLPRKFYFVAQFGVGPTLEDLIEDPDEMRRQLRLKWEGHCRSGITTVPVELEGAFLEHVNNFDFSIVTHKTPREMVSDIEKTQYYSWFFGFRKFHREPLGEIPEEPTSDETRYVKAIYAAYADRLKIDLAEFTPEALDEELRLHYRESRESFYLAEQVLVFGRDRCPAGTAADLLEQMYHGIKSTIRRRHADGYERLIAATDTAHSVAIGGNDLATELKVQDRCGLCHHLANEGRIAWTAQAGRANG